ncbi:MAG TPA: hypothetical protein VLD19_03085, partial [Chitinophagaceae bacterium]|nr:hypothetical protein [Chitinophagaceae bacterium]
MKKIMLFTAVLLFALLQTAVAGYGPAGNEPDSVYLFSYATTKNKGKDGLHFAWSRDRQIWFTIGDEYSFLRCDYGRWGSEKRVVSPYLLQDNDGLWHCIWQLNEREPFFAHASSANLVDWGRQSYPSAGKTNCLRPVVQYDRSKGYYTITYADSTGRYYLLTTKDFATYSPASETGPASYAEAGFSIGLPGGQVSGQAHRVA